MIASASVCALRWAVRRPGRSTSPVSPAPVTVPTNGTSSSTRWSTTAEDVGFAIRRCIGGLAKVGFATTTPIQYYRTRWWCPVDGGRTLHRERTSYSTGVNPRRDRFAHQRPTTRPPRSGRRGPITTDRSNTIGTLCSPTRRTHEGVVLLVYTEPVEVPVVHLGLGGRTSAGRASSGAPDHQPASGSPVE